MRRLDNITSQTHRDVKVVISDNASPIADVAAICHDYASRDKRITFFRQAENIGAWENFLFVLEKCESELFIWASDDDEWDASFLSECVQQIGTAQIYIPRAMLKYQPSGRIEPISLPMLDPVNSRFENACAFLDNMQPNIIYGLHRTAALRKVVQKKFDGNDIATIFAATLKDGVKVGGETSYYCGIEDTGYVPKPVSDRWSFRAMYLNMIGTLWKSNVPFVQKVQLSHHVTQKTLDLTLHLSEAYPNVAPTHHKLLGSINARLKSAKSAAVRLWR